ncbi:hypothetical protein LAZ67_23000998 [Cordylochernes scorpioides]|uniref:Uncharacterized protein n=1 Tax=Cordylochernes scorpioides TaxID=51811 RepID=A0ABY6LSX1_9ARAC|nr:hypothetical protein LAZ67_23000998 [Cordylochernes scorpioides]
MPRRSRPLIGRNTAASRRYRNAIAIETPLQSETRRALRRLRYSEARVAAAKTMQVPVQRIQLWTHKPFSGLQYNTHIDYTADSSVDIGQMSRSTANYEKMHSNIQIRMSKILEAKAEEKKAISEAGIEGSIRAHLKLPKKELPCFDGSLENWISWWSRFKKIHEDRNLNNDEKMHYLVQAMIPGSRAHRLMGAYTHTGENYESAIRALKSRFGNKNILVELYIRKLLNLVVLNARRQNTILDRLYDEISAYIHSLESLNIPSEYLEVFLFPLVESCLPTQIIQVWQRTPEDGRDDDQDVEQGKGDRLKALMSFLQAEVKA